MLTITTPGTSQTTTFTYENQRLKTVRLAGGLTYVLEIDDLGQLRSLTDGGGKRTTYTYDFMGRVKTVTGPDNQTTRIDRDARGRVTDWWDERRAASDKSEGPAAGTTDVTARLAGLADLHARGELTDEEYASAKARVLSGE